MPEDLTTLSLLVFVYSTAEKAELPLRREARVKLKTGERLADERITATRVRQLDFASVEARWLDALVPRPGVTWDQALPLARQFLPELAATGDPEKIAEREQQLVRDVQARVERTAKAVASVDRFARRLAQSLPGRVREQAEALSRLDGAAGYQQIYDRVQETFDGSADRLGEAVVATRTVVEVADVVEALHSTVEYLDTTPLDRLPPELRAQARMLRERFAIEDLLRNPSATAGLQSDFEAWRRRYQNEYAKFLRDYFAEVEGVRGLADAVEQGLQALTNLEAMPKLPGGRAAQALRERWQELLASLPAGPFEMSAIRVEHHPTCERYGVSFGAAGPRAAAETLRRELHGALQSKLATLRGQTVRRLLHEAATPPARRVQSALGVQDDEHWIRLLADDEHAAAVADLLSSIVTGEAPILADLRQRYPTITRENLDEAVAAFRAGLEAALSEAERSGGATAEATLR